MALWDQVEAFKWICDNIGYFGGDYKTHTIGGESAGAVSVSLHLLSPHSRPYFSRGVIESGTGLSPGVMYEKADEAKKATALIFNEAAKSCKLPAGASTDELLKCLRQIDSSVFPVADLAPLRVGNFPPIKAVFDGDFIPRPPLEMLTSGDFYHAPLLIGINKDEGSSTFALNPATLEILPFPPLTPDFPIDHLNTTHYRKLLEIGFASIAESFSPSQFDAIELYYWKSCHEGYPEGQEVVTMVAQAVSDYGMGCPTYKWADLMAAFGKRGADVFVYHFTQRRGNNEFPDWMGVLHADEISFVFGEPDAPFGKGFSTDEKTLSRFMMIYWTNFVKFGDPNIRDETMPNNPYGELKQRPWPAYSNADCRFSFTELSDVNQIHNPTAQPVCGLKARQCKFWTDYFPTLKSPSPPPSQASRMTLSGMAFTLPTLFAFVSSIRFLK